MMIEHFFETTYWVVDILPKQVPENSKGQYFRIEDFYLEHPQIDAIFCKFTNVLLKLNCYEDFDVSQDGEQWTMNPSPKDIRMMISNSLSEKNMIYVLLKSSDALITIGGDDTYMTVYHPSKEMLELLASLAASEGLFIWKP